MTIIVEPQWDSNNYSGTSMRQWQLQWNLNDTVTITVEPQWDSNNYSGTSMRQWQLQWNLNKTVTITVETQWDSDNYRGSSLGQTHLKKKKKRWVKHPCHRLSLNLCSLKTNFCQEEVILKVIATLSDRSSTKESYRKNVHKHWLALVEALFTVV